MPKFLRRQNTLSPVFKKAENDDGFNRVEGGPASIGMVPVTGDESSGKNEYDVLKEAEAAVSNSSAAKYLVKPARKKRQHGLHVSTSAMTPRSAHAKHSRPGKQPSVLTTGVPSIEADLADETIDANSNKQSGSLMDGTISNKATVPCERTRIPTRK